MLAVRLVTWLRDEEACILVVWDIRGMSYRLCSSPGMHHPRPRAEDRPEM